MTRAWVAIVAGFALGLAPSVAMGAQNELDPQGRARAEVLFQEGSDLLEAGRAAEACPKLQAAVDLAGGEALGGKLVLARCYERIGRTASAWGLYREVETRSVGPGQTERAVEAQERATALGARLHYLELVIPADVTSESTLEITIDGRVQPRASLSARLPIDPGEHVVGLTLAGRPPRREVVVIPAAPGVTRLTLSAADVDAAGGDAVESGGFWSGARIAGLLLGGIGVGGLAGGAIVGAVAKSSYEGAFEEGNCAGSPPLCDDASGLESARTTGDVGTAIFFVGLGLAAVGLVVFIVAPSEEPAAPSLSFVAGVSSIAVQVEF